MCCKDNEGTCVCEVLKIIDCIQKKREKKDDCINCCDKPTLGNKVPCTKPNTRPFVLYTCSGSLWKAFYEDDGSSQKSPYFRVENVDDCCATLRVLKEVMPCRDGSIKLKATEACFTLDLGCVCGIQCLPDIHLKNV